MSFPRYPKYKDSGVEWLGEVPEHWNIAPLKHLIDPQRPITYGIVQAGPDIPNGVPYVRPADMTDEEGISCPEDLLRTSRDIAAAYVRSTIRAGDLVCSIGPSFGKVMITPDWLDGANLTQGTARVAVGYPNDNRYLFWTLRSPASYSQWESAIGGATFHALNLGPLRETLIPVPPPEEQAAISRIVDQYTAKVDALIAEQCRLLKLLQEKKQALISRAVSKGLIDDVPLKPAGVPWLAEVPRHWEAGPLKRLIASVESGTSVNAVDEPARHGEIAVLKTSCVYARRFDVRENKKVVSEDIPRVACHLRIGTLIVSRMNTPDLVGAAGYVDCAPANLYLPDRLWQVTVKDADTRFIYWWTLSDLYRSQVEAACTGTSASMKNLGQDNFAAFSIGVPPANEQRAIVAYLEEATIAIDTLIEQAEHATSLLQERRHALIFAAVTGKIDVRNYASDQAEAA